MLVSRLSCLNNRHASAYVLVFEQLSKPSCSGLGRAVYAPLLWSCVQISNAALAQSNKPALLVAFQPSKTNQRTPKPSASESNTARETSAAPQTHRVVALPSMPPSSAFPKQQPRPSRLRRPLPSATANPDPPSFPRGVRSDGQNRRARAPCGGGGWFGACCVGLGEPSRRGHRARYGWVDCDALCRFGHVREEQQRLAAHRWKRDGRAVMT